MRKFDEIICEVLNSQDYCNKGYSVNNSDTFIVMIDQKMFAVLVMERTDFEGNNPSYEYAIYSISENEYIAKTSGTYSTLIALFPPLHEISQVGGSINFVEKLRLTNLFYELVEDVVLTKQMTGELLSRYKQYLTEMQQTKSSSMKELYAFFKEVIVHGSIQEKPQ